MNVLGLLDIPDWVLYTTLVLVVLYILGTWKYDYFKKRNLPYMKPLPFVGSSLSFFLRTKPITDIINDNYKSRAGRCVGGFEFMNPVYMIRDPELLKIITVKEFDHFMNRRNIIAQSAEPLFSKHLFALRDKRWRDMRATLSPAFTSSKMKNMFLLMSEIGEQLVDYLENKIKDEAAVGKGTLEIEIKDFFTRFSNDVIATTAFGVKVDSLKEQNNDFYQMGKILTDLSGLKALVMLLYFVVPKIMEALRVPIFNAKANTFFRSLVHDTITTREKEGIVRPDMIHLLMQARKGELKADEGEEEMLNGVQKDKKAKLEEDDIAAQGMIFFFAGFESVSNLICFSTYFLAVHPVIRERLQEEIDSVLLEHDNKITYEAVMKMKYLDMVVSESLRIYPPAVVVDRTCASPITIPGTSQDPPIHFQKDDLLVIPIYGFHHDPEYFPDPEKFDPERFSDENKHNIKPFTYMPFGVGPRFCIAQRFALMEAKVALVHLLSRVDPCVVSKTAVPLVLSKKSFNLAPDGGFWVGFKLREKMSA